MICSSYLESRAEALFADLFSRVDKDDSKTIDLDEFVAFFDDNALNRKRLKQMFEFIDRDKNGNIESEELLSFFLQGFDPVSPLFDAAAELNKQLTSSLSQVASNYGSSKAIEQFRTRVYYRELANILTSIGQVLEDSVEKLTAMSAAQAIAEGEDEYSLVTPDESHDVDPTIPEPQYDPTNLTSQIDRLESIIERWEDVGKAIGSSNIASGTPLRLVLPEESQDNTTLSMEETLQQNSFLLISRTVQLDFDNVTAFKKAYQEYYRAAQNDPECYYQYLKVYPDEPQRYTLYEVWKNAADMESHYGSADYRKTFERSIVDFSNFPQLINQMLVPASWFPNSGTSDSDTDSDNENTTEKTSTTASE